MCIQKIRSAKNWLADRVTGLRQYWADDPYSCVRWIAIILWCIPGMLGIFWLLLHTIRVLGWEYLAACGLAYAIVVHFGEHVVNFALWVYDKTVQKQEVDTPSEDALVRMTSEELADWLSEHRAVLAQLREQLEALPLQENDPEA